MVSIIVPSLNSPIIDRVIAAIFQQSYADSISEVIVVGRDEASLIPCDNRVRLLDTEVPVSPAKARNIGIEVSKSDLLIFLDSDCLPQENWLAEHLTAHQLGYAIVGGGVNPTGENYWHLSYNLTMFHETFSTEPSGYHEYFPTLNLSVERKVIDEVGMMNEALERAQDIEWTTRMREKGYQLYFCPEASVYHKHTRTNLKAVWKDCAHSGFYMRQIRLNYSNVLESSILLRHRRLILILSPGVAIWVTWRMVSKRPATFRKNWRTIPAIYITKIAWCWGASRKNLH